MIVEKLCDTELEVTHNSKTMNYSVLGQNITVIFPLHFPSHFLPLF